MSIHLRETALNEAVHYRVLHQSLPPNVVQNQTAHLGVPGNLVAQLFAGHRKHKTVPPCQLFGDIHSLLFPPTQDEDTCWSFRSFGFDFELEETGNVLKYVLAGASRTVDLEIIVGVDILDLLHVQQIFASVIFDVDVAVGSDDLIEVLLIALEFLLAVLQHLVEGHIEDDERIRKHSFSLNRQPLNPRPRVSR